MSQQVPITVGFISKKLNEPLARVSYAIKSRGIVSCGRIGNLNFYSPNQISVIKKAIASLRPKAKAVRG